ncbi:hypothetical protein B484DRAFT_78302 [Ochromonadaceae sp. CCMP2298]|nr:hypothetical protein B484DRAFT_78302 [Ochromonadaceae sp. CCMP2298]|mmetsp:Transcript_22102/g.50055  ORF Transcript_22102/g.50055 Transcript_22102/m.50055 type:complete len:163 (-) Transcript_22102:212-700(-)
MGVFRFCQAVFLLASVYTLTSSFVVGKMGLRQTPAGSGIARQAAQATPLAPLGQRKMPQDQENASANRDSESTFDEDSSNIDLIGATESSMEQSIAVAVKQLLDAAPAEPELTPVEVWNNLYKEIKGGKKALTSDEMLKELFRDSPVMDPFDDVSAGVKGEG